MSTLPLVLFSGKKNVGNSLQKFCFSELQDFDQLVYLLSLWFGLKSVYIILCLFSHLASCILSYTVQPVVSGVMWRPVDPYSEKSGYHKISTTRQAVGLLNVHYCMNRYYSKKSIKNNNTEKCFNDNKSTQQQQQEQRQNLQNKRSF